MRIVCQANAVIGIGDSRLMVGTAAWSPGMFQVPRLKVPVQCQLLHPVSLLERLCRVSREAPGFEAVSWQVTCSAVQEWYETEKVSVVV